MAPLEIDQILDDKLYDNTKAVGIFQEQFFEIKITLTGRQYISAGVEFEPPDGGHPEMSFLVLAYSGPISQTGQLRFQNPIK